MNTKTRRSLVSALACAALLLGSPRPARAFCVMQCFWNLAERYDQLMQDLTALITRNDAAIASATGRWGGIAAVDRRARAQTEIAGVLGSTEKAAADSGRFIGADTVKAQVEVLGDARAMQSTRTSLDEVKNGVLAMTFRDDLDDVTRGKCAVGLKNSANSHDAYVRANYTGVEAHADLAYLHQQNPHMPAGNTFTDAKLAGTGANEGAAAEIGIAARLDRAGEKVVHLGPNSDPASPFGQTGFPTGLDTLTQNHMYSIGVTSDTIQGKFQDAEKLATRIKNALDARAGAGLPSTMRYKFAYAEELETGWHPVIPGNPPQLAPYVQAVNAQLSGLGVASGGLLKAEDFVLISLAP